MNKMPINARKLDKLAVLSQSHNIFEIFLPFGVNEKNHPVYGLFFELVEECFSLLEIAEDTEISGLAADLPNWALYRLAHRTENSKSEYLKELSQYIVIFEIQKRRMPIKTSWDLTEEKSEVLKIYPELEKKLDHDGLLILDDTFNLFDGGIFYKDHMLHYHQLLRRGYYANPNFDFTRNFVEYYQSSKNHNDFRIAIDHRRIMPKEYVKHTMELDTWYGAPFDPEKLDDPNECGLTLVKRNKNSLFGMTNSLDRTEFFWSYRDGIKTFQIEELSDIDSIFEDFNLNKYVHSERDTKRKIFRHLDGAVKVYPFVNYPARFALNMPTKVGCTIKPKLFRIDGEIDLKNWIEIITFFFKSNEMIVEYFNPVEFAKMFKTMIRDQKT
jgi:hypothetical protein